MATQPQQLEPKDLYEGTRNLEILRNVLEHHQHAKVRVKGKTISVDAQTANALVTVHDALSAESKAKFCGMLAHSPTSFRRMINFAWQQVT